MQKETSSNTRQAHRLIGVGALSAMLGVAAGAFGAHGLKRVLDAAQLTTWDTAVTYLFIHSLGLLLVGILHKVSPRRCHVTAGWLIMAGIVLFSGSLILLALTSIRWLGAITPVGGVCFIAAWLVLAVCYLLRR
jgi:uncharacterized membrane protein YgdD (TMEM256/DUF423 family)